MKNVDFWYTNWLDKITGEQVLMIWGNFDSQK